MLRRELAEPREAHGVATLQRVGNRVEHRVHRLPGVLLAQTALRRNPIDELLLSHELLLPLDFTTTARDPNSRTVSAQLCGFRPTVNHAGRMSRARNRGQRRTPARARASTPPSSRSTTQTAERHSSPAARSAWTASRSAPPVVTTSSTRQTRSPESNAPSIRF